jgi:uncharacterized membrane protein YbhN (UPF0104 family)
MLDQTKSNDADLTKLVADLKARVPEIKVKTEQTSKKLALWDKLFACFVIILTYFVLLWLAFEVVYDAGGYWPWMWVLFGVVLTVVSYLSLFVVGTARISC